MITNETRAKLIGWEHRPDLAITRWTTPEGYAAIEAPSFDTDANAVAELRAFVRARGKESYFIRALERTEGYGVYQNFDRSAENGWNALDTTPQQQTAAFDAVFKDELERIMKPDHEAAKKWAHDVWGTLKDIALHEVLETDAIDHRNVAACYLDAMAQLDKAAELLARSLDVFEEANIWGTLNDDIRAFLERKTDDKQS